jgi:prophage DNA circulation protein
MSWQDRLRPSIILTSPSGQRFEAHWAGGEASLSKRVNRVSHPDQDGETVQDLGANSWDIPITLFFDGPDCDLRAREFSDALVEKGIWSVVHPVAGLLRLIPVKVSIALNPIESGNVVEISGEWFSPAEDDAPPAPDAGAAVEAAVEDLAEKAREDAGRITRQIYAPEAAASLRGAVRQIRRGLNDIKGLLRSANARVTAIMGTINDLTLRDYLDIASLSGAVIQLCESPGLFAGGVASRVSMFVKLGNRIIADLPAAVTFSAGQIAAALTGELWINAVACGMGATVTDGLPETRAEAVSALRQFRDFSTQATAALDALARASAANAIEDQYFPRALSAESILTLNAAVSRYLLGVAFDLKTEKRIALERPTSPMLLAIREYGASAANADYYFDLLARSNDLHGKELLLLPANKEVVIYA